MNYEIQVMDCWETDYDDIRCDARILKDKEPIGYVIGSYSEDELLKVDDKFFLNNEEQQLETLSSLMNNSIDKYLSLPKLSETSKLLQEVYCDVKYSDATMCHIDEDDWQELKKEENYTEEDFEVLKEETKKLGLEEVITFDNDDEYKIIGWGDLETRFIDDRGYEKEKETEMEM